MNLRALLLIFTDFVEKQLLDRVSGLLRGSQVSSHHNGGSRRPKTDKGGDQHLKPEKLNLKDQLHNTFAKNTQIGSIILSLLKQLNVAIECSIFVKFYENCTFFVNLLFVYFDSFDLTDRQTDRVFIFVQKLTPFFL